MTRKRKRTNLYYIVKGRDALSSWKTPDIADAYKHAVYLSRLEEEVIIKEVREREIVRFIGGKVCE